MKYLTFIIIILLSNNLYSQGSTSTGKKESRFSNQLSGKLGTGYSSQAEKFGLDLSANYNYVLDQYFLVGIETDLLWINWERTMGAKEIGQTEAKVKANTDAFVIPVYLNAQIKFPGLFKTINLTPSFTIGLGWGTMILMDAIPEYEKDVTTTVESKDEITVYSGFSWQTYFSMDFKPESSNIAFILDLGYRSITPSSSGIEFDMSGFVAKAGVKFFIN
jgi:hypothetical protein